MTDKSRTSVGVDVGAGAKGFHAVAFKDGRYQAKLKSCDAQEIAEWCENQGAQAVGVDAPCCWSLTGRQRSAERELTAAKINCFSTPMEQKAREHPKRNFDWMLNGARLYKALAPHYPLFDGYYDPQRPVSFETFPQAVACALAGSIVSAKKKRQVRRSLLETAGVGPIELTNIDWVDAALCALAADYLCRERIRTFGDVADGLIVVPVK